MKLNEYQCRKSCTDCNKADVRDILENVKTTYLQKNINKNCFKCFCQTICGSVKRLNARGSFVYKEIGRRLQDADVPTLLQFLVEHQEVVSLNLAGNNITDDGFVYLLDYILLNKNIRELDVQNNNIVKQGIEYLLKNGRQLELKSLNLKANKLDVDASKDVAMFLLKNTYLQYLNVAEVNQTASSLIYYMMVLSMEQETYNATLKSLNISRPNPGCMYFFDATHFADVIGHMLKHNTVLEALHLQKYNFGCHDIECMMSNAMYNNSLHVLDLGCNNIGDHGVHHISKWLMKRPTLKVLTLCHNIITDHGARTLSFTIPFSKLLLLDISYNKITDDGMIHIMFTLKKCPLLKQLKIFGNCIGHPVAKVVKRMLISQVLNQENIDVRPYRVDHKWYFAKYYGECCKEKYADVSYQIFLHMPEHVSELSICSKKGSKYTFTATTELAYKHSTLTIISKALSKEHIKDCKCCYCLKCESLHVDEECHKAEHPNTCTCCKCKDESSDWSIDESVLERIISTRNPMKRVEHILSRIKSDTRNSVLKWIDIDKELFEENLKFITDTSEEKAENVASCTCSWMQLNISALQKYLEESSSRNILIIPKDYNLD